MATSLGFAKLAANQPAYTGGPERALINQQSLNASDDEYKKILAAQQRAAVAKRNAAAAAETTNATYDQRVAGMQAGMAQAQAPAQEAKALINQKVDQLPTPTTYVPPTPIRNTALEAKTPTPQNPLVPISSEGVQPINIIGSPEQSGSQLLNTAQTPSLDMEAYVNMTPEQRLQAEAQAFKQGGQMQVENLNQVYGLQDKMLADREAKAATEAKIREDELMAQREKDVNAYKEEVNADKTQAISSVQRAGDRAEESVKEQLSFAGFGRSTKAAELVGQVGEQTTAQIASIERDSNRVIREYQATTLDRVNQEVDKLQAKVDQYGDARSALELQKVQAQGELLTTLYAQNPLNPTNMIKAAQALVTQRAADAKATKDAASANFKYMNENFGSEWMQNMSEQDIANYASAMDMPVSVLKNLGKTMDEQNREWEQAKYLDSKDFEIKKMMYTDELARNRSYEEFGYNMAIQDRKDAFEWNKINFQSQAEQQKALNKWSALLGEGSVQYAANASAVSENGLYFESAQPHPSANTAVNFLNPILAQAYPDGYRFQASDGGGGLGGQCKWFCQQITTLENGQGWKAGSTLADTKANFNKYKQSGQAFSVGEQQAQVGQTVLSSDSKTNGHAYTINAITPEGKWVVSESNYKAPLTVSNNRIVDPNDPKIIGILKTVPKPKYQVSQKAISALGSAVQTNNMGSGIAGIAGAIGKTLSSNVQAAKQAQAELAPVLAEQQTAANTKAAIANNPFLASVAQGATSLTPTDEAEMLQTVTPQFKQLYLEAKNQSSKALSPSNIIQVRKEVASLPTVKVGDEAIKVYRNLNAAMQSYQDGKVDKNTVDQALIIMFQKMLDPGSVVREGEYERTRQGQSAYDAVSGNIAKLTQGGAGISDKTRQDMVTLAYELAQAQSNAMKRDLDQYKTYYVDQLGMDPFEVLGAYNQYYQD